MRRSSTCSTLAPACSSRRIHLSKVHDKFLLACANCKDGKQQKGQVVRCFLYSAFVHTAFNNGTLNGAQVERVGVQQNYSIPPAYMCSPEHNMSGH